MADVITIATLNLRHGGGRRVGKLYEAIIGLEADALVLTEYRDSQVGARLRELLKDAGFVHQSTPAAVPPGTNSVLIASRVGFTNLALPTPLAPYSYRFLVAAFPFGALIGCYFPCGVEKVPLFEALLSASAGVTAAPAILMGDFNTGVRRVDEAGSTFIAEQQFIALEANGWRDAWRSSHPDSREFSWYSNAGNGFRVDHAFFSMPALSMYIDSRYDHSTREPGISDHSALIVRLKTDRVVEGL